MRGKALIANATITAALLLILGFLLRTTISERIRRAVGHEYDVKLEDLRTSNTKVLEELKSARAEREAFRAMAMSLMTSTRASTLDKRVEAIDTLWKSLQELWSCQPGMIRVLDMIGWDIAKLGPQGTSGLKSLEFSKIVEEHLKSVTNVVNIRHFLGDQLYSLYHAAQSFIGSASTTTVSSYQQGKLRFWFEESDTVELLQTILKSDELDMFNSRRSGKLEWLFNTLESKIVFEVQKELSGEPAAEQALLQADRIIEKASQISFGQSRSAEVK